jgi:hypothetical protein
MFARCGGTGGGTVMANQSNRREGDFMGDKSPKAKDRQKKQDATEKNQKAATAARKVAAQQVQSKPGK